MYLNNILECSRMFYDYTWDLLSYCMWLHYYTVYYMIRYMILTIFKDSSGNFL